MRTYPTLNDIPEIKAHAFIQSYLPEKDIDGKELYTISNKTDRVWFVKRVYPNTLLCVDEHGNKKFFQKTCFLTGEIEKVSFSFLF